MFNHQVNFWDQIIVMNPTRPIGHCSTGAIYSYRRTISSKERGLLAKVQGDFIQHKRADAVKCDSSRHLIIAGVGLHTRILPLMSPNMQLSTQMFDIVLFAAAGCMLAMTCATVACYMASVTHSRKYMYHCPSAKHCRRLPVPRHVPEIIL